MLELQPGDMFCTYNPMWVGRAINFIQRFHSYDDDSKFSHAGIITDKRGTTFEISWLAKEYNLYERHAGRPLLVARYKNLDKDKFNDIYAQLKYKYNKQIYPVWRLFFFLFPPMPKYLSFGKVVCSEFTALYAHLIGARHKYYMGTDVDRLADEFYNWKVYDVIYNDVLLEGKNCDCNQKENCLCNPAL